MMDSESPDYSSHIGEAKGGFMKHLYFALSLTCGLLSGTLLVATAQVSSPQHQLPSSPVSRPEISPLPVPAGPFGVGRIGYEWIDASRADIHSDPLKHRDLMVYLWYPSLKGKAGEMGEYLPGAKLMDANSAVKPPERRPNHFRCGEAAL
jgi:hypothetical protein